MRRIGLIRTATTVLLAGFILPIVSRGPGEAYEIAHSNYVSSSQSSLSGSLTFWNAPDVITTPLNSPGMPSKMPVQTQEIQGCAGRCWNPHPGAFRSWNGQQNGCFLQVWRQWPEGCTHFQWFNTCTNTWDPQIYWNCCVH